MLNKVEDDRIPLLVSRSNGRKIVVMSIVVMSFDDYHTNEATLHLTSSQENIKVLNEAIAELDDGGGVKVINQIRFLVNCQQKEQIII